MTDQEINEAIAEHCNWEVMHGGYGVYPAGRAGEVPLQKIPDYCSDLNAMHEAENTLSFKTKIDEYYIHLCSTSGAMPCYATARQRAEAFLRTIGKWRDA